MSTLTNKSTVCHYICGRKYIGGIKGLFIADRFPKLGNQLLNQQIEEFKKGVYHHIDMVQEIAGKLGYRFEDHDYSKLQNKELLHLFAECDHYRRAGKKLPERLLKTLDYAKELHYDLDPHHPEHYSRKFASEHAVNLMPKERIIEMCCDWTAAVHEFTPKDQLADARIFARKNIIPTARHSRFTGKRWKFNDKNINLILTTLDKIYD